MFRKIINFIVFRNLNIIVNILSIALKEYNRQKVENIKKSLASVGQNVTIPTEHFILNPGYIKMGNNFQSLYNLRIEAVDAYGGNTFIPEIVIGDNVCMNTDIHIGCINKIIIGNNVMIASRVYISDHSHGNITAEELAVPPALRRLVSKGPVVIEDNVWIGEGACILPGVRIGRNAIVGANAVVTKDVPPNSVVAGVPATVLKYLEINDK